ncbi:MAG: peptidylprolyl isomerase [Bacteroidota bacterium]|nr:peptidylprolyl isomerase [Bacteroidota bacterium]
MIKYLFYFTLVTFFFISCGTTRKSMNKVAIAPNPVLVKIETDSGTMIAQLYDQTPLHKDNFLKLVKEHFYDGLLFHRVIKNFMIQGGDPDSRNAKPGALLGEGGLKYSIPAEFDTALFHKKGALAMVRESDETNPQKASSSTQFYIVEGRPVTDAQMDQWETRFKIKIPENHRAIYRTIGGAPFLDMNYTVFGQVIKGLDVIDKIANAPKDANDRPLHDIKMKISVIK